MALYLIAAGRLKVTTFGQEFWVAFLDNRVEQPMNAPLELYVVAAHYATGVKATVKMWYVELCMKSIMS